MQRINRDRQARRTPIAVARPARADNELVEIMTLSLAGLAFTLFLIAQHAGSSVLSQMFAL